MKPEFFSSDLRNIIEISNFMKIHPVWAEMFHGGGRTERETDRHGKANSRFSQFCERT